MTPPSDASFQPPTADRAALRREARALRRTLPIAAVSAAICERLCALPLVNQASCLLLFAALPEEIDVWPLASACPQARLYLPRMNADDGLTFHDAAPPTPLAANRYGILEPPESAPALPAGARGVVVVPALMADARGYRLGYGKACYDRFLASPAASGLTSITVVAEALLRDRLPMRLASWDRPTDWVVSEGRALLCGGASQA